MSAFKKLTKSDSFVVPYSANKDWGFFYSSSVAIEDSYGIKYYKGVNYTGSFNINGPINFDGTHYSSIYDTINHLFYQKYPQNLDTHSLASSLYYESASIYRPTSSYFNYDENPSIIKNFPTNSGDIIRVISIPPSKYGNKVNPRSFRMTSSFYDIFDDGNGNVYTSSTHLGNIFYNHGLVVITNQEYVNIFPPTEILTNWEFNIFELTQSFIDKVTAVGIYIKGTNTGRYYISYPDVILPTSTIPATLSGSFVSLIRENLEIYTYIKNIISLPLQPGDEIYDDLLINLSLTASYFGTGSIYSLTIPEILHTGSFLGTNIRVDVYSNPQ